MLLNMAELHGNAGGKVAKLIQMIDAMINDLKKKSVETKKKWA